MRLRDRFPVLAYKTGKRLMVLSTFFYRKNPVKWTLKTYKRKFGKQLNLADPCTFYEKMNYWKHYSFKPFQTLLSDKLAVKQFMAEKGYGELCAKCYFHSKDIKEIKQWVNDNKTRISQFVLKTNHGCGEIFIYDNGKITKKYGRKIKSLNQVFRILNTSLKYNHYYCKFEENYKDIVPEIFVEEFINIDNQAIEYELMCNYGEIKFANIVKNRQTNEKDILVDGNFNTFDKTQNFEPVHKDLMKRIALEICKDFPFCRVDFIETKDRFYFCEFTFVKSGGINIYKPDSLELSLGEMFKL